MGWMKMSTVCPYIKDAPEVGSLISSYMIKTCAYWLYQEWMEQSDEQKSKIHTDVIEAVMQITKMIYERIERAYSAKPSCWLQDFYLPNRNLLGDSMFQSYRRYGAEYAKLICQLLTPLDEQTQQ